LCTSFFDDRFICLSPALIPRPPRLVSPALFFGLAFLSTPIVPSTQFGHPVVFFFFLFFFFSPASPFSLVFFHVSPPPLFFLDAFQSFLPEISYSVSFFRFSCSPLSVPDSLFSFEELSLFPFSFTRLRPWLPIARLADVPFSEVSLPLRRRGSGTREIGCFGFCPFPFCRLRSFPVRLNRYTPGPSLSGVSTRAQRCQAELSNGLPNFLAPPPGCVRNRALCLPCAAAPCWFMPSLLISAIFFHSPLSCSNPCTIPCTSPGCCWPVSLTSAFSSTSCL